MLGIDYLFVNDLSNTQLNYSSETSNGLTCTPHGLLDETKIRESITEEIQFESWGDTSCFFNTNSGALPYDLFAATFLLTSRYEEWLPYAPDAHHRFPAESSILHKNNVLEQPLVNQWALLLKEILSNHYPNLVFNPRSFSFLSTIDIDMIWKYRNKGFFRSSLGVFKDLLHADFPAIKERIAVLTGSKQDPFFNFKWQLDFHNLNQIQTQYFVLLGNHGEYDKNTHYSNRELRKLLQELDTAPNTNVGIHPSYASNYINGRVKEETERLNLILGKKTTVSRQHFLMHAMPQTYRNLEELGIKEDYTMGYSTHLGFRAGIAAPFYWFDLEKNKSTSLLLFPFCSMDITPLHYYVQSNDEAIRTLQILVDRVKKTGGLYISLWHNDSLGEQDRWRGWRTVYEAMIKSIKS
ncbi:MAG TPA: hypothetical protein DD396_01395 [Bacteroidetes bacterium]|nr:hypothetical protein [Bacteroidota bacterium]